MSSLVTPGNVWKRVALQVNPYEYLKHHRSGLIAEGGPELKSEGAYNDAMVAAAIGSGIGVVGITDHFCAVSSDSLRAAFSDQGIDVLPGFEAKSTEGTHLLCLFGEDVDTPKIEEYITLLLGVDGNDRRNALAKYNVTDVCDLVDEWGGLTISAHALTKGGLLHSLKGEPRIAAWKSKNLAAVCTDHAQPSSSLERILDGKDGGYSRPRQLPQIASADVVKPSDFSQARSWSWMRLDTCGDALRSVGYALADPQARVLSSTDLPSLPSLWISRVEWVGSQLFGSCSLALNPGINVIIGGRGTGKSSLLSSISWALGADSELSPDHESARAVPAHMIAGGGAVSLDLVAGDEVVTISRSVGSNAESGGWAIDAFGQGELERGSADPATRLRMVERFCDGLDAVRAEQQAARSEMEAVSGKLQIVEAEMQQYDSLDDDLCLANEALRAATESGLSDITVRATAHREAYDLMEAHLAEIERSQSSDVGPLRNALLGRLGYTGLPTVESDPVPSNMEKFVAQASDLTREIQAQLSDLDAALAKGLDGLRETLSARKADLETVETERLSVIDSLGGGEAEVPALQARLGSLERQLAKREDLRSQRDTLRGEWESSSEVFRKALALEFEILEAGVRKADKQVGQAVKIRLLPSQDDAELIERLGDLGVASGAAVQLVRLLRSDDPGTPNSTLELADVMRTGGQLDVDGRSLRSFMAAFGRGGERFLRSVSSVDLRPSLSLELNLGKGEDKADILRPTERLSVGQRATAHLLVLLAGGERPLLIDQPEDDLDNRFIATELVSLLRQAVPDRQVIASSHNPNIAVLGGTDFLVEMIADDAKVQIGRCGSLDAPEVAEAVQETLEGGREAFQLRRERYGWGSH